MKAAMIVTTLIVMMAAANHAAGADTFTAGDGQWTTGSTWDGGSVPDTSTSNTLKMEMSDGTDTDVIFDPATDDPTGPQEYDYANATINPQGSLTVESGTLKCKSLVCSFGGNLIINDGTMYAGIWGNGRIYVDIDGGTYEVGGVAYHDYTTTQTDGLMKVGGLEYQPGSHSEGHLLSGGVVQVEDPAEFTFFPNDGSHPNNFVFTAGSTGVLKIKTDTAPATFYAGLIDDEIIKDAGDGWIYGQENIGGSNYATLAVPEPATMVLLGLGGMGLLLRRRRS